MTRKSLYKKISLSRTEKRDEHRVIVEEIIGRRLGFNEVVHHKNGNKRDNRPENLQVMSRSDHGKLHFREDKENRLKRIKEIHAKILIGPVIPPLNRAFTNADAEVIRQKLESGFSTAELGREFGVNRSTIYRIKRRLTYAR